MAVGAKRRTLVNVAGWSGANEEGHHECNSDDHSAPDLERCSRGSRRPRDRRRDPCGIAHRQRRQRLVGFDEDCRSDAVVEHARLRHRVWRRSPVLMRITFLSNPVLVNRVIPATELLVACGAGDPC